MRIDIILLLVFIISVNVSSQYPTQYTVDSNTLHLYHFDSSGDDSAGSLNLPIENSAGLTASIVNFGNAVSLYDGESGAGPYVGDNTNKTILSDLVGTNGAFTFEALVMPMVSQDAIINHMEIISLDDSDANTERGFQFRINSNGQLRFQTIAGIITNFDANISFVENTWYHAAVTYNGQENTPDNLKLYWTRIDTNTTVQEVGSFQLTDDLKSDVSSYFSIGNELRGNSSADYTENFEGIIDEVRISDISRSPSDMLYISAPDTLHYYRFNGDCLDLIRTDPIDLVLGNNAEIDPASYESFGSALDTYQGTSDNAPFAGNNENKIMISQLVGPNGAFTLEAWVKPYLDSSQLPNHMQIISLEDNDGNTERGFHFRITDDGSFLEFTSLSGQSYNFKAPIDYVPDSWYHAAVTYNGQENTPDNLKFYWSRINAHTAPQLVGAFQAAYDLKSDTDGYFCVGNELRSTGGYTENFEGLIDEVRISQVARNVNELNYLSNDGLPIVINDPQESVIKANDTLLLECSFTCESLGAVSWFKATEPFETLITDADDRVSIELEYDTEALLYKARLIIDHCIVSDNGDYFIAISNDSNELVHSDMANVSVLGLWANWTLNDTDYDENHYREVINGKDAFVDSIPVFTTGADQTQNGAVVFNNDNGTAVVDSSIGLVLPEAFTISYWANWNSQTKTKGNLYIESNNKNTVLVENGLTSDDNWQHICAVFDGNKCCIYLDGILKKEQEWNLPAGMTVQINIGSSGLGMQPFNGKLDDIRIYNYALNNTEIAQLRFDFSAQRSCISSYSSNMDWTGPLDIPDCKVDLYDLNAFAYEYLGSNSIFDIYGPLSEPDGVVSMFDFSLLAMAWLDCGLFPDCQ